MTRLLELLMVALVPALVGIFSPPLDLTDDDDRAAGEIASVEPLNHDAARKQDSSDAA